MKREYTVGEKIKFVGPTWCFSGKNYSWEPTPQKAEITKADSDRLKIIAFSGRELMIHPRQVTHRIRPRKKAEKPERLEYWRIEKAATEDGIRRLHNGFFYDRQDAESQCNYISEPVFGIIHLIELRPGEIPVSQKDLWTALRTQHGVPRPTCHEILDQLGFPKEAQ